MKVAAHPLLVAVALGLLGPGALQAEAAEERRPSTGPCDGCDCGAASRRCDDADDAFAEAASADEGLGDLTFSVSGVDVAEGELSEALSLI
jgi:hypothetical protein